MKQHQVAQQRVVMRLAEVISGRHDKEHFRTLAVDGNFNPDAGEFFDFIGRKLKAVFESVRWNAQMIAGTETVCCRLDYPVNSATDRVQQLAGNHGDLGRIDSVRTEHRTASALGALVEVIEPLLHYVFSQLAAAGECAEDAST